MVGTLKQMKGKDIQMMKGKDIQMEQSASRYYQQRQKYVSDKYKQELIKSLKKYSLQTGQDFTLASGQKSNIYVDIKKTAMRGYESIYLLPPLLEELAHQFEPYSAIAGVVLGGCHLASLLQVYVNYMGYAKQAYPYPAYCGTDNKLTTIRDNFVSKDLIFVRREAKIHGTQNIIEKPELSVGAGIVLVEDVITTGNSAIMAAKALESQYLGVVGIIAVVDRRVDKTPELGGYPFRALVDFEELVE
jgi:orotate phosphoribosyltransferase